MSQQPTPLPDHLPPPPPANPEPPKPADLMVTPDSETSSSQAPEPTPEEIAEQQRVAREKKLVALLERLVDMHPELKEIATLLGETLDNVTVETSEVFPGWKPKANRPNDVWILVKSELWVGGRKAPISALHQNLPGLLSTAMFSNAPASIQKVLEATFIEPLVSDFGDMTKNLSPDSAAPRIR